MENVAWNEEDHKLIFKDNLDNIDHNYIDDIKKNSELNTHDIHLLEKSLKKVCDIINQDIQLNSDKDKLREEQIGQLAKNTDSLITSIKCMLTTINNISIRISDNNDNIIKLSDKLDEQYSFLKSPWYKRLFKKFKYEPTR